MEDREPAKDHTPKLPEWAEELFVHYSDQLKNSLDLLLLAMAAISSLRAEPALIEQPYRVRSILLAFLSFVLKILLTEVKCILSEAGGC
jgi:hypothetical protein